MGLVDYRIVYWLNYNFIDWISVIRFMIYLSWWLWM